MSDGSDESRSEERRERISNDQRGAWLNRESTRGNIVGDGCIQLALEFAQDDDVC